MNITDERNRIEMSRCMLGGLCIYRNLLSDPVITAFRSLIDAAAIRPLVKAEVFIDRYSDFFHKLSQANKLVDFQQHVFDLILLDENAFTVSASCPDEVKTPALGAAANSDIRALRLSVSVTPTLIKKCFLNGNEVKSGYQEIIEGLPDWTMLQSEPTVAMQTIQTCSAPCKCVTAEDLWQLWNTDAPSESIINGLTEYHAANGSGIFAGKYAFTWQRNTGNTGSNQRYGSLIPVQNPDPVRLSDLIAYELEREEVIKNTEQFLEGFQANNVLLYGDRGTGKSSTVKALLNEYSDRGLRMVEVPKHLLTDFPGIIGLLAGKPHKFILFVDDLSFEDSEDSYTALKAVIEGGLEVKPQNVLIYATSNRRHLIRENFSDRAGLQFGSPEDEIRSIDTMQEKLSLSDRFGITVIFASPDKKRFLEIVDKLAQKKGIGMDTETLHKEALKWELWYNGRSPRTAQQFINYMSAKTK